MTHLRGHSVVRTATCYGLNDPGIESWWGRNFAHPSKPALESTSFLYNTYQIPFQGIKHPGCGVDQLSPLPPRLKSRTIPIFPVWAFTTCYSERFYFPLRLAERKARVYSVITKCPPHECYVSRPFTHTAITLAPAQCNTLHETCRNRCTMLSSRHTPCVHSSPLQYTSQQFRLPT